MKELLMDLLRWASWAVVIGLVIWLQKVLFKK
jgi:hypothetical protein